MGQEASWRAAAGLTLLAAFVLGWLPAPAGADEFDDWLSNQDGLTGDWGGLRGELEKSGIDIDASYAAELAGNPVGGKHQGFRYAHEIDFGAELDMRKLVGLDGTTLNVVFAENAGRSLSEDRLGNIFGVQEVFSGKPDFRLAELSIEQSLLDERLELKLGRIVSADDFAVVDVSCNFQSEAFCYDPGALGENSGFTDSPIASWGGRFKVQLDDVFLQAGAYEVNPTLGKQGNGFKLDTSGATGAIVPVEIGWNPADVVLGLPGQYRFGGYYDSSDADDVTAEADEGSPPRVRHGRWGLYVLGQQLVYREAPDSARGLTVFAVAVFGDSRTAEIQWFAEAGLVYQGTFAGRDADTVDLGFAYGHINDRLIDAQKAADEPAQSAETVIELNYGAAATPWLHLRPGLQIVVDPGADADVPTALVLGLQSEVDF